MYDSPQVALVGIFHRPVTVNLYATLAEYVVPVYVRRPMEVEVSSKSLQVFVSWLGKKSVEVAAREAEGNTAFG